jgi:hypothetical protein
LFYNRDVFQPQRVITRRGNITKVKGTMVETFIMLGYVEDIWFLQTHCITVTCICGDFTEVSVRVNEPSVCLCVQIQMQTVSLQGTMRIVWAKQCQYVGRHSIAFKFRLTWLHAVQYLVNTFMLLIWPIATEVRHCGRFNLTVVYPGHEPTHISGLDP